MRQPEDELAELQAQSLLRKLPETPSGCVNFASNDYLGLASHPRIVRAYQEALSEHGAGSTASRLVCGNTSPHIRLEELLADAKGTEAAITFATGFATSTGVLTTILQPGDTVVMDKLCHASLIDGARMSGATIRVFPHNHLDKLERILRNHQPSNNSRLLVVTESVFSMDGDLADLVSISRLTKQHGALLMVDEAHALGVLGPSGMGLAEELDIADQIDFHMGTLGKAAGVAGGYLAASRAWVDFIINKARSLIYSTAPPPAQAAAAAEAISLIRSDGGSALRQKLWQNIRKFSADATSAIIPHIVGGSDHAMDISCRLRQQGILAPAIRFPTVPRNTARLRITISANHSSEQIAQLQQALLDVGQSPS
ncbi:MAG: aminotransferase class I/II-fold pyridoxal phosphate-dependent enzyme [Akkermansiaceae bacterium]